jgi:hypothetical protein
MSTATKWHPITTGTAQTVFLIIHLPFIGISRQKETLVL